MAKDVLGNELKVGDKVVLQVGGMALGEITQLSDGGLTAVIPGSQQAMTLPGTVTVKIEQNMQFDSTKPLGMFKVVSKEEIYDLRMEPNKVKPN